MILYERIKLLIKEKHKNTHVFLKDIGFNHNFMQDLEKGKKATFEKVIRLAEYFSVTSDYLLGLSDNPHPCTCCLTQSED